MIGSETLQVKLLHPEARVPERTRAADAAYDLRSIEQFTLGPGERRRVRTGVAIALPPEVAGLVLPRSGLAAEHGITIVNAPGLIDPGYRGECLVILCNLGDTPYTGHAGDRIAQLLLVPFVDPPVRVVDELRESPDGRGEHGFGSSGR